MKVGVQADGTDPNRPTGSTHRNPSAADQCKGGRQGLMRDQIRSVAAATSTANKWRRHHRATTTVERCLKERTTTSRSCRRNRVVTTPEPHRGGESSVASPTLRNLADRVVDGRLGTFLTGLESHGGRGGASGGVEWQWRVTLMRWIKVKAAKMARGGEN
jgi:hypothetical protein